MESARFAGRVEEGLSRHLVPLNPQVFIDWPPIDLVKNTFKYIDDPWTPLFFTTNRVLEKKFNNE